MRFALLLLIFTVTTLAELALLIELSRYIGTMWTIIVVICTAFIGTAVLRRQGLETLARINKSMARGTPPVEPLVEGFFLVLAGAFLVTPGLITDMVGFSLFVPQVRQHIARWALKRFLSGAAVHVHRSSRASSYTQSSRTRSPENGNNGPIIDGEFERIDEKTRRPPYRPPHDEV